MPDPVAFNHLGHCVTDLERSKRFYSEVFGFEEVRTDRIPDEPAARLLGIDPPLRMTAAYMARDGFLLELMEFAREGNPPPQPRPVNQPGLTHLSFCVENLAATLGRVEAHGGSVIPESDVGTAVFVRDPDGQRLELVDMAYRPMLPRP